MILMNDKFSSSGVTVTISCDRNKTCINVSGNVSASYATDIVKSKFSVLNNRFLLPVDITASPDGYLVNIQDKKSIREYLFEKEYLNCADIFFVCSIAKEIFELYGEDVFKDILFDYNAVFVNNDISELSFVYLPLLSLDKNRVSFNEFLRVLFVHMEETDPDSEKYVKKLISTVTRWEKLQYDGTVFSEINSCIEEFKRNFYKDMKKDVFSKGVDMLRKLLSNTQKNSNNTKTVLQFVLFSSEKPRQRYVYAYDRCEKCFFSSATNISKSVGNCLKIGRDSSWADIHIPDMTVNSRFGVVDFNGEKFCMMRDVFAETNSDDYEYDRRIILSDGQRVQIGKNMYIVKVRNLQNAALRISLPGENCN